MVYGVTSCKKTTIDRESLDYRHFNLIGQTLNLQFSPGGEVDG
jgi:hypothetical protein